MEAMEVWITPAISLAGLAFLWRQIDALRRDVGEMRERMARLEGLFAGFTGRAASELPETGQGAPTP